MSATSARNPGEMAAAPAFSYAQAAKGSSSSNSSSSTLKENAVTCEAASKQGNDVEESEVVGKDISHSRPVSRRSSQEGKPHEREPSASSIEKPESQETSDDHSKTSISARSSPAFGTTSASTLLKDDDVFTTPNASSESTTWEKISGASQADDETTPKPEGDGDDAKLSSWEHISAPVQLKEAPPPAFNIWQKRAEDAQAKARELKPAQASVGTSKNTNEAGLRRGADNSSETNRKRTKPTTAESTPSNGKELSRNAPGRSRSSEESQ